MEPFVSQTLIFSKHHLINSTFPWNLILYRKSTQSNSNKMKLKKAQIDSFQTFINYIKRNSIEKLQQRSVWATLLSFGLTGTG